MSDIAISWLRTIVPVVVGTVVSWIAKWLLTLLGVEIPDALIADTINVVSSSITVGCIFLYYALARWAEEKWGGKFSWLVGYPKVPEYHEKPQV